MSIPTRTRMTKLVSLRGTWMREVSYTCCVDAPIEEWSPARDSTSSSWTTLATLDTTPTCSPSIPATVASSETSIRGNFRPLFLPGPYPGGREGTVDGVANLVDAGYRELQGNHVMSFCEQGGLRVENGQVVYPHRFTDFTNREVRAHYGFPPRDLLDLAWLGPSEGMHTLLSTLRGSAHRRRLGAKAAQVAQQLGVHVKRSPRGRNLS